MTTPKVLVVGQPFTRHTGGGITLSNLFAGWDPDKLAVACVDNLFEGNIDTSVTDNYYRLGEKEHKWAFPLSLIKKKYPSGPVTFEERQGGQKSTESTKRSLRVRLIMDYFFPFLQFIGVFHLLSRIVMSDELKHWLDEYDPDVIYAQAPTREMVLFCIAIHDYLKKPMIYHVMDDWPSTIGSDGLFKNYWKKVVERDLKTLLGRTDVFMSISDFMSEEYKRRYGRDSVAFHNPIEIDFWKKYQRTDYALAECPNILYAGRTGLGIDSSLVTVAQAVAKVNKELGTAVRFTLQTGTKPDWIDQYDCVYHNSFVPYEELPRVFSGADFLLLPYDFSDQALKFIKYSMPTKAPEFMVSGTPIIIFGPDQTALVNYARAYNWAEVVTRNSVEVLADRIKHLVQNESMRRRIALKAVEVAESRHDAREITRAFSGIICSLEGQQALVG
ncbi:MAG: group 1 glycosyl transferase [Saprospiraceae bacterium]|nr:group 1 glycosyl transferase [Lewinella sp.]